MTDYRTDERLLALAEAVYTLIKEVGTNLSSSPYREVRKMILEMTKEQSQEFQDQEDPR